MNAPESHPVSYSERQLIASALEGLHASSGITGRVRNNADAHVSFQIADKSLEYVCVVKQKIDRYHMLEALKARSAQNSPALLVCPHLSNAMALRCQELDIQFIDTAGNAYLTDQAGILIQVAGRRTSMESLVAAREMTITPAALRLMFAFLAKPSMLNASYRDMSTSIRVSTGAIGKVLDTLAIRGFIATTPDGKRVVPNAELMLSEWAGGYTSRLRPKLKKFRFAAAHPDELRHAWTPEIRVAGWSGEVAAEVLTRHLNPATFTIYMDMENAPGALAALVKQFRLRADPHGQIEVVQPFWNMSDFSESFPTVPLHVVYADLLGTQDSRNLIVAREIARTIIKHGQDSRQ